MVVPDLSQDVRRQIAKNPPKLRGVLHMLCLPVAFVATIALIIKAPGAWPRIAAFIYGLSLMAMFGFSAAYHRGKWTDSMWWHMRKLDHTGIYLVIAGSYTGISGMVLSPEHRWKLLGVVWLLTAVGIAVRWLPLKPPFGMMTTLYILLVAAGLPFRDEISTALGSGATSLITLGGAVYLFGAFGLGLRKPDPWPNTFGYHEIWHVMVTTAAALHFFVVWQFCTVVAR